MKKKVIIKKGERGQYFIAPQEEETRWVGQKTSERRDKDKKRFKQENILGFPKRWYDEKKKEYKVRKVKPSLSFHPEDPAFNNMYSSRKVSGKYINPIKIESARPPKPTQPPAPTHKWVFDEGTNAWMQVVKETQTVEVKQASLDPVIGEGFKDGIGNLWGIDAVTSDGEYFLASYQNRGNRYSAYWTVTYNRMEDYKVDESVKEELRQKWKGEEDSEGMVEAKQASSRQAVTRRKDWEDFDIGDIVKGVSAVTHTTFSRGEIVDKTLLENNEYKYTIKMLEPGINAYGDYFTHNISWELYLGDSLTKIASQRKAGKVKEELQKGIDAEKEHHATLDMIKKVLKETKELPSDEEIYESIARDHLSENASYYTLLEELESKFDKGDKKESYLEVTYPLGGRYMQDSERRASSQSVKQYIKDHPEVKGEFEMLLVDDPDFNYEEYELEEWVSDVYADEMELGRKSSDGIKPGNIVEMLESITFQDGSVIEVGEKIIVTNMPADNADDVVVSGNGKYFVVPKSMLKLSEPDYYKTLNDASIHNDIYEEGDTEIWYYKPEYSRDISAIAYGLDSADKDLIDPNDLSKTHVKLGSIKETNLEKIFYHMQGENWSPMAEAKELILGLGASHTSMSVGDIVVKDGTPHMVANMGFTDLTK